jgi:hypothetical protein
LSCRRISQRYGQTFDEIDPHLCQKTPKITHIHAWRSGKERHSAQGLEITKRDKVKKLRDLEAEIASLVTKRKSLPTHVSLVDFAIHREVLCHEAKAIMDRVKICAYNAEEWMLDRLIHHYGNAHDVRALLRSFAELSRQWRRGHRRARGKD